MPTRKEYKAEWKRRKRARPSYRKKENEQQRARYASKKQEREQLKGMRGPEQIKADQARWRENIQDHRRRKKLKKQWEKDRKA